jgi:hypothetical protein
VSAQTVQYCGQLLRRDDSVRLGYLVSQQVTEVYGTTEIAIPIHFVDKFKIGDVLGFRLKPGDPS